jgi:hypothetical protein
MASCSIRPGPGFGGRGLTPIGYRKGARSSPELKQETAPMPRPPALDRGPGGVRRAPGLVGSPGVEKGAGARPGSRSWRTWVLSSPQTSHSRPGSFGEPQQGPHAPLGSHHGDPGPGRDLVATGKFPRWPMQKSRLLHSEAWCPRLPRLRHLTLQAPRGVSAPGTPI